MIRNATQEDFPSLVRIGHDFYEFNPYKGMVPMNDEHLKATFQALLSNGHVIKVLEEEGKVVGAGAAYIAPLYWNFEFLQAQEIFWWIDPPYRTKGNGIALKQALEDEVKECGVKFWNMIALETSEPEKMGKLYKSQGFQPTEHHYMKVL